MVTSGYDGGVGLFDLETGAIELIGYHDHLVNRITVNPSGTRAASSSSDYHVRIWDLERRCLERILRGHSDDVEDFAFITDHVGASVSRDHRILVWDLTTGAITRSIEEHEKDVLAVVSAGDHIYTSGDDRTLRQWDWRTGRMVRRWGPFEQETDTCAIDPVMGQAVLGSDDGLLRLFNTRTGEPSAEFTAHCSGIKKVCTSPRNGDIMSAGYDQRIRIWDARTLQPKAEMVRVPSVWERSLNWSPDGNNILGGTFDGTVVVWDAGSGLLKAQIGDESEDPGNACFNDVTAGNDGIVLTVSDDGYLRQGRLTSSEAVWVGKTAPLSERVLMNAVVLDETYHRCLAGSHDHALHDFETAGEQVIPRSPLHLGEGPVNCIRVASNPGYEADAFVACYSGAIVRIGRNGKVASRFRLHKGAVKALRIHPSQPVGVSCSADGTLASWTLDGELMRYFAGHTAIVDDVDIDPSGRMIASVGRDFVLKVHDLQSGALLHAIRLGRRSPKSASFFTESTIVVGDYWGSLIRVDLGYGTVTQARIARNGISSLCRDGRGHLVASSYDGSIYLVRPSDLHVVNVLTAMVQRPEPNTNDG